MWLKSESKDLTTINDLVLNRHSLAHTHRHTHTHTDKQSNSSRQLRSRIFNVRWRQIRKMSPHRLVEVERSFSMRVIFASPVGDATWSAKLLFEQPTSTLHYFNFPDQQISNTVELRTHLVDRIFDFIRVSDLRADSSFQSWVAMEVQYLRGMK